jgi:hypothetical protein
MPVFATPRQLRRDGLSLQQAITLAGLTANLKVSLDAAEALSYPGTGQTIADRSGTGSDFYLGTTDTAQTDDPSFNGNAGALSKEDYLSFDGGDTMQIVTAPSWAQTLHKNGAVLSAFYGIYYPASPNGVIWGDSQAATAAQQTGACGYLGAAAKHRFIVLNAQATVLDKTADAAGATSAWHILGVSVDENGGAGAGFLYRDGAYDPVGSANTWNPSYTSPSSADSPNPFQLSGAGYLPDAFANGTRLGFFALWQGVALTKANFDTLFDLMRPRYGL